MPWHWFSAENWGCQSLLIPMKMILTQIYTVYQDNT